ncbi:MAG TPA: GNAT family N-acetyltransferase [Candidatus Ozemobacteraceae bacterium]|nr:GNAT family N-acetyltransferase [Candidatus Ozemobacteraceae bacterium]
MKSFEVSIERATIHDSPALIQIQNLSFYDDFVMYGECPAYEESLEAMQNHISNKIVYKILVDGKIIGDVIIRKREDNKYYLRVFSIIPEFQGKGIGTKAFQYIESEIRDAAEWELITPFKSFRNHHFYEKLGFHKTSEYCQSDRLILFTFKKTTSERISTY